MGNKHTKKETASNAMIEGRNLKFTLNFHTYLLTFYSMIHISKLNQIEKIKKFAVNKK